MTSTTILTNAGDYMVQDEVWVGFQVKLSPERNQDFLSSTPSLSVILNQLFPIAPKLRQSQAGYLITYMGYQFAMEMTQSGLPALEIAVMHGTRLKQGNLEVAGRYLFPSNLDFDKTTRIDMVGNQESKCPRGKPY